MVDSWHKALPSAGLSAGKLTKVHVAGRAVLLVRLEDGTAVASALACPHEAADLSEGNLYFGAVDCPRHHYLYDLRTGENRYPRQVFPADLAARLAPLRLFSVKESDGWIWVEAAES
jgi:nitrite reductase/ring-hydroxylating ferredoxin subunit